MHLRSWELLGQKVEGVSLCDSLLFEGTEPRDSCLHKAEKAGEGGTTEQRKDVHDIREDVGHGHQPVGHTRRVAGKVRK
jgi:hypothetical protein